MVLKFQKIPTNVRYFNKAAKIKISLKNEVKSAFFGRFQKFFEVLFYQTVWLQLLSLQLNSVSKLLRKFWDQSQVWISLNKEIHIWYRICDLWENLLSKVPMCNAPEDIYVQGMMSYCLRFIRGSWTCLFYTFFPGQNLVIFSLQFWAVVDLDQFISRLSYL